MSENKPLIYVVDDEHDGQRLDNYLIGKLKRKPKSLLYRAIRVGRIRIGRKRVKPHYRLQAGDEIWIPHEFQKEQMESPKPSKRLMEALAAAIIHEDDDLLILNKPSGLAVHGGSGIKLGLIEGLRALRTDLKFLELVHRLDRGTSGCICLAKHLSSLQFMHEQLREGGFTKKYLALVEGHWPKTCHEVDAPLKKAGNQSQVRLVEVDYDGKDALTKFRVERHFADTTLVEAIPVTGRTHQIRVHAAHKGHALAGDDRYASREFNKYMRDLGCRRLFLHAKSLSFPHPDGTNLFSISAPLEPGLQALLERLADG